jgi:hypothetical protein
MTPGAALTAGHERHKRRRRNIREQFLSVLRKEAERLTALGVLGEGNAEDICGYVEGVLQEENYADNANLSDPSAPVVNTP